tara:strand:- start:315 stop:560 length:246 start_codon:yes stop_codon:yes gene_type:complete
MDRKSVNKGLQLRFVREYRGYTQSKLCKEIKGLSQANLSKFENGFDGMLKDDKVAEIMKHLNWNLDWLDRKPITIYSSWDL